MTSVKNSKAFDIIVNNKDDIEIKSIKSNQENVPFAFQKRDKIPMDSIENAPSPTTPSTPSTLSTLNIEKESRRNLRASYSSLSALSSLSNLPYDERPVPTIYNKMKKAKEDRAKKTVSLMDVLSDEKKAQLSWKKSMDDDIYNRPKSVVSRSSAYYDKQQHRSSMTIIAEVISSDDFNSDSESEYEEDSEIRDASEITESNKTNNEIKLTEDNDSLTNNINNNSSNNLYPAECVASSIEDIKANANQVENSSIRTSIVTQEQIDKHLSRPSLTIKKSEENKSQIVPELMITAAPEVSTPSVEENKLLDYDSTTSLQIEQEEHGIKLKTNKKSKKSKKNSTPGCQCIIS